MDFSAFEAKWGGGIGFVADILRVSLAKADEIEIPLENWQRVDFDEMRKNLRAMFVNLRSGLYAPEAKAKGIDSKKAKAARTKLKTLEAEAIQYLAVLERRFFSSKTRPGLCMALREWRKASDNPNISPRQLSSMLQQFLSHDYLDAPSDNLTRQLVERIERADFETEGREWPTAMGIARGRNATEHWAYELMPAEEGRKREGAFLPAADIDQKLQAAMVAYAKGLGDTDSDLMIFAMERFAKRAKHPDDKVTIGIDELMDALGYHKRQGGKGSEAHSARDKAIVRERFEKLQHGYLTIRKAGKDGRTNKTVDVESVVLIIEDRAGQADLDGRVRDWTAITVRFGRAWSYRLFEPHGKMTALLQAQALRYDSTKERLEKRLLKRLGWFWKLNLKREPFAQRQVLQWIRDDIGDDLAKYHLREDAERLEMAFDRLKRDGQIAGWRYADGHPGIEETHGNLPRGWFESWLQREIIVEAPQALQVAYQERQKAPAIEVREEPEPADDIGAKFRAFRTARGISALAAAQACDMANATLSRIETGKRQPTTLQRKAMLAWMNFLEYNPDKMREATDQ